ncbi:MAG: hypothetical protein K9L30_15865 [Desulfobacterales bacterium]|nr:hypothetical protein [Desulfobacterales bacterium]
MVVTPEEYGKERRLHSLMQSTMLDCANKYKNSGDKQNYIGTLKQLLSHYPQNRKAKELLEEVITDD